ncbi:Calx-beta domain-containing protein, partial [Candidatus Chloroploca asiatica]|uniref:Calx-beta domain-containing protein n=1 Tax=Candidatus Chloroploca asiatica TaxID=1506545 RepID=UPI002482F9CE
MPGISRYSGEFGLLDERPNYSFWPLPFRRSQPPSPPLIEAAETDRNAPAPNLPGDVLPTAPPVSQFGLPDPLDPTPTPSPTATQATASPTSSPTASPTVLPAGLTTATPVATVAAPSSPTPLPGPPLVATPTAATPVNTSPTATPITAPGGSVTPLPATPVATTGTSPPATPTTPGQATATATATPLPATATPVPATATPVPATATPTNMPTPTVTPEPEIPSVGFSTTAVTASEEDGFAIFEVRLSEPFFRTVSLAYQTSDGTATAGLDYRPASGTLVFRPGEVFQTIRIEILPDELNEPPETVFLRLSNPVNATLVGSPTAVLTILDSNAPPTVRFLGSGHRVSEDVGSTSVTIELTQPSAFDVQVPFVVGGTLPRSEHTLRDGTVLIPAGSTSVRLRFGISDNRIDEDDRNLIITLGSPTNANLGSPSMYVLTVEDNDTAGVTLSQTAFTLDEGQSATYTVVLKSQPVHPVVVRLNPDVQLAVAVPELLFTPDTWNVPQTVSFSAVDDQIDEDDLHTGRLSHTLASLDPRYNQPTAAFAVPDVVASIRDNDTAGVEIVTGNRQLSEHPTAPNHRTTYSLRLKTQPLAPVTLSVVFDRAQLSLEPVVFQFNASNWNVPQVVNVTAVNDAIDEADLHTTFVDHLVASADPRYDQRTAPFVPLPPIEFTILDNDTAGLLIAPLSLDLHETPGHPNHIRTYTVRLNSQPMAPVSVVLSFDPANPLDARLPREVTVNTNELRFTAENWNVPQTIVVTTIDDRVDELDPHFQRIHHTTTSSDLKYEGLRQTVVGRITDNDSSGLVVITGNLRLSEDPNAANHQTTYLVNLSSQPVAPVIVNLDYDASQVIATPSSLIFTPENWNDARVVTVRAVDDRIDEDDLHTTDIRHTLLSSDPNYNQVADLIITIEIIDNDTAGVAITPTTVDVTEGGTSASYNVRLESQPTAPVTITLGRDAAQVTVNRTSLTFTPGNWNTAQSVQVTAVDDAIDEADVHLSLITHTTA